MTHRLFTFLLTDDTTVDVTVKCMSYVDGARKARAKAEKVAQKRGEWCERLLSTTAVPNGRAMKIRGEDEHQDHEDQEDRGTLGMADDPPSIRDVGPDSRAA